MSMIDTMPPGMVYTLRLLDHDPGAEVHGPMLKGLMTRGLVRHGGNRMQVTWAGQKLLNILESENEREGQ